MAGKVKVNDGKFSTIDLSTGQRKRLALVSSYLEDRPIYFFDEWACDQDPEFKHIFYAKLLLDLKARGKNHTRHHTLRHLFWFRGPYCQT
jgi:putative pyoverdin transport system ATP-binding/permease protein